MPRPLLVDAAGDTVREELTTPEATRELVLAAWGILAGLPVQQYVIPETAAWLQVAARFYRRELEERYPGVVIEEAQPMAANEP
jgi:hypothetical protein